MKAPLDVAEQLALEQRLRDRRAVLGQDDLALARPVEVDRPGHQFLAGAALALDQHGQVAVGDLLDQVEDLLHRRRAAHDVAEAHPVLGHRAQPPVLAHQVGALPGVLQRQRRVVGERLDEAQVALA